MKDIRDIAVDENIENNDKEDTFAEDADEPKAVTNSPLDREDAFKDVQEQDTPKENDEEINEEKSQDHEEKTDEDDEKSKDDLDQNAFVYY